MSSIPAENEKETKEKASDALRHHVKDVCDLIYLVKFESDDGGHHLALYVEVPNPTELLEPYLREALVTSIWMGWRLIVLKVPPGYIEVLVERSV